MKRNRLIFNANLLIHFVVLAITFNSNQTHAFYIHHNDGKNILNLSIVYFIIKFSSIFKNLIKMRIKLF